VCNPTSEITVGSGLTTLGMGTVDITVFYEGCKNPVCAVSQERSEAGTWMRGYTEVEMRSSTAVHMHFPTCH